MSRWPGGLIRKTAITPAGPFQDGAAPGVWTIMEAAYWVKQGLWPLAGNVVPIAVFSGGSGASSSTLLSINIATLGNTSTFGTYTVDGITPTRTSATGSSTRGLFSGNGNDGYGNGIYYITIATTGTAADFGDLTVARYDTVGMSNAVRSVTAGGYDFADRSNVIDYVTIASTGNSTDFGDATVGFYNGPAGFASSTRGVFGLGIAAGSSRVNTIEYITISSTGNSTDFGDLTANKSYVCGASNNTRGIFCGGSLTGNVPTNVIEYVTIASTGNATDFGDLTQAALQSSAAASPTRLIRGGGANGEGVNFNVIDFVTISTTSNATDFGDLSFVRSLLSACCSGTASAQA